MGTPQLIYTLISLVLCGFWIRKAQNKWFLSAILLWLFSLPILEDPRYIITLPFAGFDLQSNRILFFFLVAALFILFFRAWVTGKSIFNYSVSRFRFYELLMAIFILVAMLTLVLNLNAIGSKTVTVSIVKLLTFLLMYSFARECISPQDFHLLAEAIVTYAILSSLVGIYQFFVDPQFFRLGTTYVAFGPYLRGNGLFFSEYEQGLYLTMASIVGLLTLKNRWVKTILLIILPAGVFCTMHRGSWLILLIALVIILIKESRRLYPLIFVGAVPVILAFFVVLNMPLNKNYSGSFLDQMINQRVQDNTINVRMTLNQFAIHMIEKYPLGIGDYSSNIYVNEAYNNAIDFVDGKSPLIVHNGFLAIGVLYGLAGMIAFTLFILVTILYYLQKKSWSTSFGAVAALIMIVFLVINMTQDLSFMGEQYGLFIGLMIGSATSMMSLAGDSEAVHTITFHEKVNSPANS